MVLDAIETTRDIGRLYHLASVLARHGFGDLARRAGIARLLERAGKTLHLRHAPVATELSAAQRVRLALEEMGPTFIKLGQIFATRVDLFPPDWIVQFEQLQDHAAPLTVDALQAQLRADLGAPPEELFDEFDPVALAAGSIAQVHRARLRTGEPVVLKIRRPGIERIIDADLRLLRRMAVLAEKEWPAARRFRPTALVDQFSTSLHRELDLRTECRSAERIAANLAANPDVVIPKVYWQWTRASLNVQAFVDGIPGRDMEAVTAAALDRRLLARRGARAVLQMILRDGFFHADPHAGNVFYLPDNRIALIDFGMVGRLSAVRRGELVDLLFSLAARDSAQAAELLANWGGTSETNITALTSDLDAYIDEFHGLALRQIDVGHLLRGLAALMRANGLVLPADLALLFKAAISLEGLGRMLNPDFDMVAEASPYLMRIQRARRSPRALAKQGAQTLREAAALAARLPAQLRRLLKSMDHGALRVHVDLDHLDRAAERLDRGVSRLTMGIVTAALIIGSSIVMTAMTEQNWLGLPFLGLLGFIAAVAGGFWLLFSIARSGRHDN